MLGDRGVGLVVHFLHERQLAGPGGRTVTVTVTVTEYGASHGREPLTEGETVTVTVTVTVYLKVLDPGSDGHREDPS
jgi:hypothetical protein